MFCSNCGQELPNGAIFCTQCGKRVQSYVQENIQITYPLARAGLGSAITSWIFFFLSLIDLDAFFIMMCVMFGVAGVVLSIVALAKNPKTKNQKGVAIAGLITSATMLVVLFELAISVLVI